MTLGIFIIALLTVLGGAYAALAFVAERPRAAGSPDDFERILVSSIIAIAFVGALAIRPAQFGVDTLTYFRLYDQFCFTKVDDLELSYSVVFWFLNLAQFGACSSGLLTATWVLLIFACFLLLPDPFSTKIKLAALSLFSLIGTELATNALRQGLSASVAMLAIAWFSRNRLIGIILAIFSLLLHASTGLVIVAVAISFLRFRYYAIAFSTLFAVVLSYSYLGLDIEALNRLTGEINKYAAHDSGELYVRLLAAVQLFVPLIVAYFIGRDALAPQDRKNMALALKISLTAIPYLPLPYFGYRYIYGIYLIVLYLCRKLILSNRKIAFEIVLLANALIALVWALGSTYIRQIPFVVL